jgi:undecaprenyl pyrophosphate phosphatase UppP
MSMSFCNGPFFLFVPLILGGVITFFTALALRSTCGVLPWYGFALLFIASFILSMIIVGGLIHVVRRWRH